MLCTEHWLCIRQMDLHISSPSKSALHDFVLSLHGIHDVSRIISAWTQWVLAGTWVDEGLWSLILSHIGCVTPKYIFPILASKVSADYSSLRIYLKDLLPPQFRLLFLPQVPVSLSTSSVIWVTVLNSCPLTSVSLEDDADRLLVGIPFLSWLLRPLTFFPSKIFFHLLIYKSILSVLWLLLTCLLYDTFWTAKGFERIVTGWGRVSKSEVE